MKEEFGPFPINIGKVTRIDLCTKHSSCCQEILGTIFSDSKKSLRLSTPETGDKPGEVNPQHSWSFRLAVKSTLLGLRFLLCFAFTENENLFQAKCQCISLVWDLPVYSTWEPIWLEFKHISIQNAWGSDREDKSLFRRHSH